MKLLKCHITGFGRFSSVDYDFSPNVNCFCLDNGAGKTTLAAFLKATFYGLETTRINSDKLGDRRHFLPFGQSAGFGGSVEFEYDGAVFRIEREFDGKSEKADKLRVYRNGVECDDLGNVPGLTVFKVDAPSFERTLFWGAGDLYTGKFGGTTPGISTALGESRDAGIEGEQLSRALGIAEKKIGELQGKTKKDTGRIPACKNRISSIGAELSRIAGDEEEAAKLYEKRAEQINKAAETEAELRLSRRAEAAAKEKKIYEEYAAAASSAAEKAAQINGKYARGIPPLKTAELIDGALERLTVARGKLSAASSHAGEDELAQLESVYANGIPSEEESRRLSELEQAAATVTGDESIESSPFADGKGEEALAHVKKLISERDAASAGLKKLAEQPKEKPAKAAVIAAVMFAILAAAALIAIFIPALSEYGRAFIAAAAVSGVLFVSSLIAASVILSRSKKERAGRAALYESERKRKETEAVGVLMSYGYVSGNVDADRILFEKGLEAYAEAKEKLAAKRERAIAAAAEVAETLGKYGLPADGSFTGERIRKDATLLQSLRSAKKANSDRRTAAEKEESEALESLRSTFEIAGLGEPDPATAAGVADEIRTDSALFAASERDAGEQKRKAEDYLAAHPDAMTEFPDGLRSPETVEAELSELRRETGRTDEGIRALERSISDKPLLAEELREKSAELESLEDERDLLSYAATALKNADASLKRKFSAPVRGVFERHASEIEAALGASLGINENYEITFESGGLRRDPGQLSSGQRAVAAICFRTAICDSVYPKDKPFLILDDPFESLDKGHMKGAADLIRSLAEEYQIIYFCAHESRIIGD